MDIASVFLDVDWFSVSENSWIKTSVLSFKQSFVTSFKGSPIDPLSLFTLTMIYIYKAGFKSKQYFIVLSSLKCTWVGLKIFYYSLSTQHAFL